MKKVSVLEVSNIRNQSVEFFAGTKKYIATGDVDEKIIKSFTEITYDNRPSRANIEVKLGQVLFARMKGTNKVIQIDELNQEYIYSTGFCVLEPSELVTTDYLRTFLKSDLFQVQKDKYSKGATQKAINNEGISKIKIPLPPLETQKKIVETFDEAQALIDARKEQIRLMDELIKSRFFEMFGDLYNNSRNWIKAPMGDYLTILTDFSANGSYEYLDSNVVMYDKPNYALMVRTTDLEKQDFERDVKYIDENAYRILEKSKVFGNEIIMNKIGSAGKVYLMPCLNRPVSLGRNAFLFRYNESINVVYMYYLLTSGYGTNEIMQHVRGAVTKTITKEAVRSVRILVPPIEKQNEFANSVRQIEESKFEMLKSLDEIYATYQSIVQQFYG